MKKIGIEELLQWAFCDELPKAGTTEGGGPGLASGAGALSEMQTLGTIVDRGPNAFGVVPFFAYEGEPHEDALTVGRAVHALAGRSFDIDPRWSPFPEWPDEHGLIAEEVSRIVGSITDDDRQRLNGRHVISLVITCAVLKRGPDWTIGKPPATVLFRRNGKDPSWFAMRRFKVDGRYVRREVDGFDYKRGRPAPDAYNKRRLGRSIMGDLLSRLDWQLWQSALDVLAEELAGHLAGHCLQSFNPNRKPWPSRRISLVENQVIENA